MGAVRRRGGGGGRRRKKSRRETIGTSGLLVNAAVAPRSRGPGGCRLARERPPGHPSGVGAAPRRVANRCLRKACGAVIASLRHDCGPIANCVHPRLQCRRGSARVRVQAAVPGGRPDTPSRLIRSSIRHASTRIRKTPAAADGHDGRGEHRDRADRAGAAAQPRCRVPVPSRQQLLLPHRIRRARGGGDARARARTGRVRDVLPGARSHAGAVARGPARARRGVRAPRRRRRVSHRRHRRHPAGAAREQVAGLLRVGPLPGVRSPHAGVGRAGSRRLAVERRPWRVRHAGSPRPRDAAVQEQGGGWTRCRRRPR